VRAPASNGRFWLCPQCRRHVPFRKNACACGFDRTTSQVEVHEVAVHAPESQPRQRSAFATLSVVALSAVLVGWIARDRLPERPAKARASNRPSAAASPVAAPEPVSVEVAKPSDAETPASRSPHSSLPAAVAQAPVARVETAQQVEASPRVEPRDERPGGEADVTRSQREAEWRTRAAELIAQLRSAHAAYRAQLCAEARGGIAVSTTVDNARAYVSARTQAQALEESARLAGVPPGWARIPWSEFPPPEDPASGYHPAAVAERWGCGNVTGWGH